MHVGRTLMLLAALVAALAPGVPHAQSKAPAPPKRLRIAVLDIRALATEASKAELLSEVALTEAASLGAFDVIGKSDINAVIGFERQKQVMGCGDDSTCLAEIGGALGVDYILVGSLGTLGSLFRLDLKLVESKKARVRSRVGTTVEGSESKLVAAVQKATRDLLMPLTPEGLAMMPGAQGLGVRPGTAGGRGPGVSAPTELSRRSWSYIAGGTGAALLVGGAVAGLQAKSAFDAEKKAAASGDLAAYDSNKSKAKSMALVADVLLVGGAAGIGVGTWLFLTSKPPAVAFDLVPVPGGAVASISGGF